MKDLTVLVSACGAQFMPGLADCLKDNGERYIRIVGVDMGFDPTVRQMVDALYQVPAVDSPNYIDRLLEICKAEKVDVVLPFMSAELLPLIDRKRDFEAIGTRVSVADRYSVEITNNKYRLYQFMKKNKGTNNSYISLTIIF